MSQQLSSDSSRSTKRPASIYTVMLGISVVALTIACWLLLKEWNRYDREIKAKLSYVVPTIVSDRA